MKLVAQYNTNWVLVDTKAKTWEFVERATREVELKIMDDIVVHKNRLTQVNIKNVELSNSRAPS